MKARSKQLLDRAIAAMLSAIEVYNKPNFAYRAESFTILAINAWELLLKAKWLKDHNNRLTSLYVRQGGGPTRKRLKRTQAGNAFTHGLDYLANKLRETAALDEMARENLRILAELRDSSIHFYHQSPHFAETVQAVGAAAVKNFHAATLDWFRDNLSRFNFYLMPLSFVSPTATTAILLGAEEKRLARFIKDMDRDNLDATGRYSVTVDVELRFVKSQSKDAATVRLTNDPNATAVRLTEEQIRSKFPNDYFEIVQKCRARYSDFKTDAKFHQLKKDLEPSLVHVRLLDPANATGQKKAFYSESVMNAFDENYTRRR
jgi:hypothetical protein